MLSEILSNECIAAVEGLVDCEVVLFQKAFQCNEVKGLIIDDEHLGALTFPELELYLLQ